MIRNGLKYHDKPDEIVTLPGKNWVAKLYYPIDVSEEECKRNTQMAQSIVAQMEQQARYRIAKWEQENHPKEGVTFSQWLKESLYGDFINQLDKANLNFLYCTEYFTYCTDHNYLRVKDIDF